MFIFPKRGQILAYIGIKSILMFYLGKYWFRTLILSIMYTNEQMCTLTQIQLLITKGKKIKNVQNLGLFWVLFWEYVKFVYKLIEQYTTTENYIYPTQ